MALWRERESCLYRDSELSLEGSIWFIKLSVLVIRLLIYWFLLRK